MPKFINNLAEENMKIHTLNTIYEKSNMRNKNNF